MDIENNPIKEYINKSNWTLTKIQEELNKRNNTNTTVQNLSKKINNGTLKYNEILEIAEIIGYKIAWIPTLNSNIDTHVDLSNSNLDGANLSYSTFEHAELQWCKFNNCDFWGASFEKSDFNEGNLQLSDFSRVNFSHSNFFKSNLSSAIFSNTNLEDAIISNSLEENLKNSNTNLEPNIDIEMKLSKERNIEAITKDVIDAIIKIIVSSANDALSLLLLGVKDINMYYEFETFPFRFKIINFSIFFKSLLSKDYNDFLLYLLKLRDIYLKGDISDLSYDEILILFNECCYFESIYVLEEKD